MARYPIVKREMSVVLVFRYKNYKGVESVRRAKWCHLWEGTSPFHEGQQVFLKGFDLERDAWRDYAWKDVLGWLPPEIPDSP